MIKRIVIFTAAFAFVLCTFAYAQKTEGKKPGKDTQGEKIERRVESLGKKLNLTESQKVRVRNILTSSKSETVKIFEDAKEKVRNLKVKTDDEIEQILEPAQKDKFKQMRKNTEKKH